MVSGGDHGNLSPKQHLPKNVTRLEQPHLGWFRVEEEALRHLKRTLAEPSSYRKACAAYVALLRIANLRQSMIFDERIGAIADDMGYAYNDAAKALQLVRLAGLCEIEARTIPGSKERDKSVYTVKRMLPGKEGTLPEKEGRLPESQSESAFAESTQEVPKKENKNNLNKEPLRGEVEAEVIETWNKTGLTKCKKLTAERSSNLQSRLKSDFWRDNWREGLGIIAASPYCGGKNARGWIADIDWFIRSEDAVAKALEGKYGVKKRATRDSSISGEVWHGIVDSLCREHNAGETTELPYIEKQFKKALQYAPAAEISGYVGGQIGNIPESWKQFLINTVPGEGKGEATP